MDEVVDVLSSAQRPLIIAGGGVPFDRQDDVLALAGTLHAPIVSSWLRKPVPDRHPNFVGMAGIGGSPAARRAIADADAVLALGCRFSEQMTEHYHLRFAPDARMIHIDLDPAVIGRVYPAEIGIAGNLSDLLPLLRTATTGTVPNTDIALWLSALQAESAGYREGLDAARTPGDAIGGRELVRELRRLLPDGTKLVLDSGNYLHWADQYFPVDHRRRIPLPHLGHDGIRDTRGHRRQVGASRSDGVRTRR